MVPRLQVTVPEPIEQAEPSCESMVHDVPASVGRGSVTVTPLAWPGPEFKTSTVKPIWSPAETGSSSAVLVMAISAHCTVTEAWVDWTRALLVAHADAWLT